MKKRKRPLRRRASARRTPPRAAKKVSARSAAKRQHSRPARPPKSSAPSSANPTFPRLFERRISSTTVAAWLSSPGSSRAIINLTHDAVIIRNADGIIEAWNTAAEELYGYSATEAIGRVSHELLGTRFPKNLEPIVQTLGQSGYWEGELDHRRKDGKRITVLSRWSLLRSSGGVPLLVKEINHDVTQERRQVGYLRLLNEVGRALMEAESPSEALRCSLTSVCVHTRWCMGRALSLSGPSSLQQPEVLLWHVSDEQRLGPVRKALEHRREKIGEAPVAARALESNESVWIENIAADPYLKKIPEISEAGLLCAFAQPVIAAGTRAVLLFFSDMPAEIDEPFLSTMNSVAAHLCRFFERLAAQEAQRQLSASLMRAQDDERRRIARELHDSAGQYLGALGLSLEAVRRVVPADSAPVVEEKLAEAEEIIRRCSSDLRTLSHLLHPPLLEDLGLASAVNWYISGFAERSGIKVSAEVGKLPRFNHTVELTLFRILQECLTNIHRHSESKTAAIALSAGAQSVILEIRDEGKGIPRETLRGWSRNTQRAGVGINGMRERLNDLGGTFEITSDQRGTVVRATIPLRTDAASSPSDGALAGVTFTMQDPAAAEAQAAPPQSAAKKPANGSAQMQSDASSKGPAEKSASMPVAKGGNGSAHQQGAAGNSGAPDEFTLAPSSTPHYPQKAKHASND